MCVFLLDEKDGSVYLIGGHDRTENKAIFRSRPDHCT